MEKLIKTPSGATVELKEIKDSIVIVYQLDENNNRIRKKYMNGYSDMIGIVNKSKVIDQL